MEAHDVYTYKYSVLKPTKHCVKEGAGERGSNGNEMEKGKLVQGILYKHYGIIRMKSHF
jgi:hypothetical protein